MVVIVSEHELFRQCALGMLRDRGVAATARPGRADGKPVTAIVDLDHATTDAPGLLHRTRQDLGASHVVAVGQPLRLAAAAAADEPDATLETTAIDASTLVAAARRRLPRISQHVAKLRRAWAAVTPRQLQVLRHLAIGLDNSSIAARLGVGVRAIKAHVSALLEVFHLDNRTQLALLAREAGLRAPGSR